MTLRVGCAGWNVPRELAQRFASEGSHLERYSRILNCSEINTSFYRPHMQKTWERWAQSVPDNFRFSVKMPKSITHEAKLHCGGNLAKFLEQSRYLGKKLGPILIQLAPSHSLELAVAKTFFALLRDQHSGEVVLEPRHPSWFEPNADDLLQEFRMTRVAADPACVPAAAEPSGYKKLAYYRLHGSPRRYYSAYSSDFIHTLATKLVCLAKEAEVWCIFDNTASGSAARNALDLATHLALSD